MDSKSAKLSCECLACLQVQTASTVLTVDCGKTGTINSSQADILSMKVKITVPYSSIGPCQRQYSVSSRCGVDSGLKVGEESLTIGAYDEGRGADCAKNS
jgi:hypothetical protein